MWSPTDGNLSYICLGTISLFVPKTLKFKNFETRLPAIYNNGRAVKYLFFSCLYWYATLKSCKYLKSETHFRNAQVNKAFSMNKRFVKICLVVDMVRKNWSWVFVAGCGLHYFVSARFGSFWVFANFRTAERFKYLFFTAMKIHTMGRIVKEQNNFSFSSLVTKN